MFLISERMGVTSAAPGAYGGTAVSMAFPGAGSLPCVLGVASAKSATGCVAPRAHHYALTGRYVIGKDLAKFDFAWSPHIKTTGNLGRARVAKR
jgi:hypothetical protein